MILDLRRRPNQKTHESENASFLVWALPEVKNRFRKHFLIKYYITTSQKKLALCLPK